MEGSNQGHFAGSRATEEDEDDEDDEDKEDEDKEDEDEKGEKKEVEEEDEMEPVTFCDLNPRKPVVRPSVHPPPSYREG